MHPMTSSNHLFDGLSAGRSGEDRTFMRMEDDGVWSYNDTFTLAARMANTLIDRGVRSGDRVVVQAEKSPEAVALYLACIMSGAVFLPLNTAYTASEVAYFIGDAEPTVVVCDPSRDHEVLPLCRTADAELLTLGRDGGGTLAASSAQASSEFATVARGPNDLAAILYTSGTTGRSKGAMLSHDNLLSNALALQDIWQFSGEDVLIHALPIYHAHGLFVGINVTLTVGASIVFLPRFNTEQIIAQLPGATAMMGVPTYYTRLLAQPDFTAETTSHMRVFISGSAPLLAETHAEFEARTGNRILERYGMTETTMIASNPYCGERRAGAVGFPLPGVDLRICAPDTGTEVVDGEIGVIEVRGPNVFQGYWRQPDKTAEEMSEDGYFRTGDLGRFDADGYLHIVGRGKDLIISGGFNIYPKEVETEIDAVDGVAESAVIGVPHPDFGEGVVAVVVSLPDAFLDEVEITAVLADKLARFKLPKRIFFTPELPRNAMGKVLKNELRQEHAEALTGDQ
ncbi:MAG: malonyl-CoA synthase [Actinomycetia bacterium]|nr:malonyl-CoA synthase [Actinomycetes bacterium]